MTSLRAACSQPCFEMGKVVVTKNPLPLWRQASEAHAVDEVRMMERIRE